MAQDGKVKFIRKNGRLIPIRSKGNSKPKTKAKRGAKIGAAVGAASTVANVTAGRKIISQALTKNKFAAIAGLGIGAALNIGTHSALGAGIGSLFKNKKKVRSSVR